jgi:hypothetical protein
MFRRAKQPANGNWQFSSAKAGPCLILRGFTPRQWLTAICFNCKKAIPERSWKQVALMKRSLLFFLLVSSSMVAQKRHDARWIDGLKKTPAYELGTGLPHENFARWFADLVMPNKVGYRVEQCDLYNPADGSTDKVFCVVVYTKPLHPGWNKWIDLSFIVGSKPPHDEAAKYPDATPVGYIFLRGIESPTDPQVARPDRVFSELSELEDIVRGSHPTKTASITGPPT